MAIKEYTNGEITVFWDSGKCKHAGNCVKGSPNVFKPRSKPWVAIDAETSKQIMHTIDTCLSGALSYRKNNS